MKWRGGEEGKWRGGWRGGDGGTICPWSHTGQVLECHVSTVNSPLTDTLVNRQLYLRTLFSILVFTSQSNSVFAHSRNQPLSRKCGHRHFWKCFFSLFAFSHKRTPHVLHKLTTLTEQQISGDRFSQAVRSFDMNSRKSFSCYFWLPNKT